MDPLKMILKVPPYACMDFFHEARDCDRAVEHFLNTCGIKFKPDGSGWHRKEVASAWKKICRPDGARTVIIDSPGNGNVRDERTEFSHLADLARTEGWDYLCMSGDRDSGFALTADFGSGRILGGAACDGDGHVGIIPGTVRSGNKDNLWRIVDEEEIDRMRSLVDVLMVQDLAPRSEPEPEPELEPEI